jgi:hypothetical protein
MATTNIQSFAGDVEVSGELTVTGQLNSTTGSDKVKLTATAANETDYIPLSKGTTGAQPLYTDSNLTYNPANNVIGGNVSGNAAFATNATYANSAGSATNATFATTATNATNANAANKVAFTNRDSTDDTDYIAFVDGHTAEDKALFTDQNLTYNSSTNYINANVPYANNAGTLQSRGYSEAANASSIVSRDGSGHINMVYGFSSYLNMSHASGTRSSDTIFYSSTDAYIRKTNATGMRASLNVPTRTGGNASGTWSINVNGNAAFATNAGGVSVTTSQTKFGLNAGQTSQGPDSVAIGKEAGLSTQGTKAVAVGYQAGYANQGTSAIAVGREAGRYNQGNNAIALGYVAGQTSQGTNSVAINVQAGRYNQGNYATALGYLAGSNNQGNYAVAIGYGAGGTNQPISSFYLRYVRNANGQEYLHYNNTTGEVSRGNNYSDDRLKYNEKVITGAIKSLFKLRPEEYDKKPSLKPSHTGQYWKRESGLIAQEIFYSAPEFRHIVQVPQTAGDVENYTPPPSDDPNQDPDYSVWGEESPSVKYEQFVPYLIKGVQEIVTELPRSKTTVSNAWGQNITGLVVSANANAHKTNTTPIVALSNVYMDKKWYGVVSEKKTDTNDYDTLVDTKGDTQIWVTDAGGPLQSGDLVTTSNVAPGYAQKQGDDLLRSSTVAKVTQDCDFTEPAQRPIRVPKQELSNVTYYLRVTEQDINLDEYEKLFDTQRKIKTTPVYVKEVGEWGEGEEQFFHGETQVSEEKYKTLPEDERSKKWVVELELADYEKLTDEEKAEYTLGTRERWFVVTTTNSKNPIPEHTEEVVVQEMMDVLDENGQIVWEETANAVPVYTLVDHSSYKAALVSAKLV